MSPTPSDARCATCGMPEWHGLHRPTDVAFTGFADCNVPHAFVPPTRVDEAPEGEPPFNGDEPLGGQGGSYPPREGNVPAQEEVVCALWDFARALGIPNNADTTRPIMDACGPALERIMAAFNCRVTEIQ